MSSLTQTTLNDFDIIKTIGKGSFSIVYLVKRKLDSKVYALKSVFIEKLPKNQQDNSVNEVRILASVHHQNVISYKEAFWDDKTSSLNIVMEYADDGDLYTKIKKMKENKIFFEEKKIWDYTIQIIQGLKSLHDKNIMHRDLKSENIFLTKNNSQCKIGDMNVSKVLKEKLLRTQTGTPYYASPEVWMNKPYSFKSDLWSIGCVIYEMCELKTPFTGKDMDDLFINVCLNKVKRISDSYSDELWFMITKLLEVNVDKRFNCKQFLECDIVKKKIIELKNFNNNFEENKENDKSLLLNTIYFNDIKDIKKQLPHQKFYNDESTTESNGKKKEKEKENISYIKANDNILLIKNLKKELENLKNNQELIKKEKGINSNVNNVNKKSIVNQKIKQWNIKFKNIQFKNKLELNKIKKYKISIPNNINYKNKNIKFFKRPQLKDLSNNNSASNIKTNFTKFNNSLESIDSYYNINRNKNKNYISYRNINLDNFVYKKNKNNSFNRSISYNMEYNKKIPMVIINTNNININHNHKNYKNINGKLFNRLKFLNLNTSNSKVENININKSKNKKIDNKYQININFNFIPNNYQRYIKDNTNNNIRYSLENTNSKSNVDLNINNIKNNMLIYYKKNFNTKPNSLIKANSHKKLLDINIDSNLRRIKSLLSRNSNSKNELKEWKNNSVLINNNNNNLIKHKSFSGRIKTSSLLKIPKKKLINKKHLLMNKIPKCIISNTNRNILNIPLSLKKLKTCNNIKEKIYTNRNYLV